ncbi:hypothetical protein LSH36_1399g00034 [Paralvinella palmiformis]|uniref:Fibrinogen C-terminal domain-containing protein n=1 Tax=Paralvinella palmiformis TaxID=53620 RepID=A0AAD9ITZ2_9ANNE|nr:hypothetical protein LSH36_1399g00034 [Paralvinella palmiformis]
MSVVNCSNICLVIWWMFIGVRKCAVIIEERGLQPDDVTPLNDNSTRTCSTFASTRPRHTQIFAQSVCSTDKMSITLVGQRMKCDNDLYVAGLAGPDVGKPLNKWQSCQRRWENTTDDGVEWCSFNCDCINGCDQIMVLRWPKILADTSWNLCDIIQSCTASCPEAPCYNGGTCENNTCRCLPYCQGQYCEMCAKDPYPPPINLTIDPETSLKVVMDEGWIIVLRRRDKALNVFDGRYWVDYENGFGDLASEFWLGNKYLHLLTNNGSTYKCRVDMLTNDGEWRWAEYGTFSVGTAKDKYRIGVYDYNSRSTAGDAWTSSEESYYKVISGTGFTAKDKDNDGSYTNCAETHHGGWWYYSCSKGVLTGEWEYGLMWNLFNLEYVDFLIKAN